MSEESQNSAPSTATVKLSEIKIDSGLYPRVKGHDPELVQHYARDMEVTKRFDVFHLHSHGEDIGWILNGEIRHPRGHVSFCDAVFRAWLSLKEGDLDSDSHRFLERNVVAQAQLHLEQEGFLCCTEVAVQHGRVDIVAKRGTETRVIECKADCATSKISSALGQLLFYKADFDQASMYVALPHKPSKRTQELLELHGVSIMVVDMERGK